MTDHCFNAYKTWLSEQGIEESVSVNRAFRAGWNQGQQIENFRWYDSMEKASAKMQLLFEEELLGQYNKTDYREQEDNQCKP